MSLSTQDRGRLRCSFESTNCCHLRHSSSRILSGRATASAQAMDNETSLFIVRQGNVSAEGLNREPLNIAVPMTLLYSAIFMTGVLGNVMTCSVICQNRVMRTCTNYYLFSLAGSDLLLLVVGMPPEIYSIWSFYPYPFGRFFCRFRSLAAEASTNASVLTIMAFTIERYLAICHPFRAKAVSRPSRAIRVIMLIWVLGFGLALPQALQFDVIQAPYSTKPGDYSVCDIDADKLTPEFFILSFALFFSLPMILITILYIRIALRLNANAAHADISTVRFREYDSIIQLTRSGRISGYPLRLLVRANRRISERKAVIKMLGKIANIFNSLGDAFNLISSARNIMCECMDFCLS